MSPERFQQIEELYHAARAGTSEERKAVLAQADPDLRREVEALLAQSPEGEFMERPAIQNAARLLEYSEFARFSAGARLGPYQIERKLGEGGMGEVFRAIDTRLGRAIAIKITEERFSDRFEREARAIASLNHPNICTLHDVGPNYLVMELLEGETLAAKLKNGPLPIDETLRYSLQIVDALAEAHARGIVHRDLKPGNIMIAKSGVKVLDFGLAKSEQDESITASQLVMGTPAYMSPEQRAGKPADPRTDIYSFGCVLYEMLTGTRIGSLRRRIASRRLQTVVNRCLEEDAAHRWQSAAELEQELRAVSKRSSRGLAGTAAASSAVPRAPGLLHKTTIVLGNFANHTGDKVFDGTLRAMMAAALGKSRDVSVLSDARIRDTLRLMLRPLDTRLWAEVAAEIGERTGCSAAIEGSIARLGRQYVLSLITRNCRTGEILKQQQLALTRKDDIFKALGRMAKRLGTQSGTFPSMETPTVIIGDITTPSIEAWRSYTAGMRSVMRKGGHGEAMSLLKRAVEVDPQFAMAYALLGRTYDSLGQSELAAQSIATGYELRDRVSDRENFFVTFNYHRQVSRNLELARQTLETWVEKYPGDLMPHGFLSGMTSPGTGRHEKAVKEAEEAIAIDPNYSIGYFNAAFALLYMDRLADAEALLQKAANRGVEAIEFSLCRYFIAFLRNDKAAMESELTARQVKLEAQGWFHHQEALTAAYQGRVKEANRLSDHAIALARQGGLPERAAMFTGTRAVWNALFENRVEARRSAENALALCRGRDADYGPAFALALLGDAAQARQIQADLSRHYPEDTSVQFSYLPALQAMDALHEDDPRKALERTQAAAPYELAVPGTAYFTGASFFGALYPVYVRGLAYGRLGRHREAAGEFQKLVDHPGMTLSDPIGPRARLELARMWVAGGNRAKGAVLYRDLLSLWQNADSDAPLVAQAIAESALLR